jgi:hypothetical protein
LQQLHPRNDIPPISLYADDVVLFCHPIASDLDAVREILRLFGRASGLNVNFSKSSASLLRCSQVMVTPLLTQLGCPIVDLPITYIGIHLTLQRPTGAHLQPVIDNIARRLPT